MSVLAYPPPSEDEIFRHCTKECGIITATEDQQYFALGCLFCSEKFLYFDAFIGHMQIEHAALGQNGIFGGMFGEEDGQNPASSANANALTSASDCEGEDLTDADPALLEPHMVMVKQELVEEIQQPLDDNTLITGLPSVNEIADVTNALFHVKQENPDELGMEVDNQSFMTDSYRNYESFGRTDDVNDDDDPSYQGEEEEDTNYDDLVEESLLGTGVLTLHIKDHKMIQFLIDSYRQNPFLWDHHHSQFRDRNKRQKFLDWIVSEFKRRFNISLAKDAITRKWDNLRTVYKRECNRMSLEKTNVSTLWYFKELHFLNRLYGGNQRMSEAVIKETVYRRRYSALWNDVSTGKLLAMVQQYPCFYDKYNIDYRSKEKRGEALQQMAAELQKMIDVTTIQISKRISQLRFDYSKQKQERLQCEQSNKAFAPSYTYYDQMSFMDADVAPFKCEFCTLVLQTTRELEMHLLTHQPTVGGLSMCPICHLNFMDEEQLSQHKQLHLPTVKEVKFYCDLCTASFREKSNYEEHMRRHNDELLLPTLTANVQASSEPPDTMAFVCDICGKSFSNSSTLISHRALHSAGERNFRCDYPHCGRKFTARQNLMEHVRLHYSDEEYRCDVCGKAFKSVKNLQNHKQIHDAIKRYVCKICGSAFAQAAGLYLHKRRHNRPNARIRQSV